jgi:Flp pilus assembly protein TadG
MSRRHARTAPRRGDSGVASLEVVALYPLLVLFGAFALQVGAAMWTVTATNEAVRTAARAASLGEDPYAAAARSLPDSMNIVAFSSSGGTEHTVRMQVRVPRVSPLPPFTVTRDAVLP